MSHDPPTQSSSVLQGLHNYFCEEDEHDFQRMKFILSRDPGAINRPSVVRIYDNGAELCLTPLLIAIECKHLNCVQFLLEHDANMKPRGTNGRDAMSYAIKSEFYEAIKLLIEKGFRLDYTHYEYGPLDRSRYVHSAASQASPEMVQFLIDQGALTEDIDFIVQSSELSNLTPAVTAISNGRYDTLKVLLLNGAIFDPLLSNLILFDEKSDCLLLTLHLVVSYGNDLNQKIKVMNILYHFGGDFLRDTKMGPNPLRILQNDHLRAEARHFINLEDNRNVMGEFSASNRRKLAAEICALTSSPMSLKGLCRLSIKHQLGHRYYKDVRKLTELPRELIKFLYFEFL